MQLFYSNTSPYSRKVRLVILEKGLQEKVRQIPCNPFEDVPALTAANPLGKVPTLVTDNGVALYDSPVICAYLDELANENRLIPASGENRWRVLRWEALADGILDAAYSIVMEKRRTPQEQSARWPTHWETEIARAIQQVERDHAQLPNTVTLAQLALGSALGYLDFRLPGINWRDQSSSTKEWYEEIKARRSMRQTQPE